MKKIITLFLLSIISNLGKSQTLAQLEKLKDLFETAGTADNLKDIVDGDAASAICDLLSGSAVCEVLSVTSLNTNEDEEMKSIKSKFELDQWLSKKGIDPNEFYQKLWINRNSETIQDRLKFLSEKSTQAQLDQGIVKYKIKYDKSCGGDNDFTVSITNSGDKELDVFYAVQRIDGTWNTGLKPNFKSGNSSTFFSCNSTNRIMFFTRVPSSGLKFPNNSDLNKFNNGEIKSR